MIDAQRELEGFPKKKKKSEHENFFLKNPTIQNLFYLKFLIRTSIKKKNAETAEKNFHIKSVYSAEREAVEMTTKWPLVGIKMAVQ